MAASRRLKLFSWGANSHGQLCAGHKKDESVPMEVPRNLVEDEGLDLLDVQQICGGGSHVIFLTTSGDVYSCGQNNKGQLGFDTTEAERTTLKLVDISSRESLRFRKVACGWEHTICLTDDGQLWGWGSNNYGQLGIANIHQNTNKPRELKIGRPISKKIVDVAAGPRHSLAVTETGELFVWGCGRRGQLGLDQSQCLNMSQIRHPTKVTINAKIVSAACGMHHSLALSDMGEVYAWGCNRHGVMAKDMTLMKHIATPIKIPFPENTIIRRLVSGWSHVVAISESQAIFTWGRNDYGQLGRQGSSYVPTALTPQDLCLKPDATALIVTGAEHNIAIKSNQTIVSWGWNEHGICGVEGGGDVKTPQTINSLLSYSVRLIGSGYGTSFAIVY